LHSEFFGGMRVHEAPLKKPVAIADTAIGYRKIGRE
jgi:hypothetical protein